MARKSIKTNYYLFDASAREVVIPGGIQREQLILITNVTDNKVIYNFSDPELTATTYEISTDIRNVVTTRLVLAYDTTSMSDTDKLQIVYDDFEETMKPAETYMDSVNKQRVSTPQSQIDTDFEYGVQNTKWESLSMINNNPFAYKTDTPISVTSMEAFTDSKTIRVSVNTAETPLPAAGTAIFVQDTIHDGANGVFIVDEVLNAQNQFLYTAAYAWTAANSNINVAARTAVYTGTHYTGSDIGGTVSLSVPGGAFGNQILATCSNAHGLEVGNEIAVVGSAGTNVNGSWVVSTVYSPTSFGYYPDGSPSGAVGTGTIKLYPRPQGSSKHRAFDGGVKFSTNSFSKNQQAIRQTKRYFRYQSGKGVAFSTGSILEPAIENIDSITASGTTVTVKSADAHLCTRDTVVDVRGCGDNSYNGVYQISNVIDPFTFQYTSVAAPTESVATGEYTVTPVNSYGTNLEIGMMDQQNGIFFRWANGGLSVVRRTSTFQLSGRVQVTQGSTLVSSFTSVNGTSTTFAKQLKPGDYVVIRGSSYRVDGIISDTQMVIFPDYRGPSATNVPVTKTVETEWKQSDWNIDRCDGTGKTGYTLDPTKMQMFYMDYSWYGAGFIRWGFRALDGDVIYAHKIPNNNQNTEAYMRSGNLPARYEVNTIPPTTQMSKTFSSGDTTLYTNDALDNFPEEGTLRLKTASSATAGLYEYINYTGKTTFVQDIIAADANNNTLTVADTTGLAGGGQQTIVFDTPFSNISANKTYYIASVIPPNSFSITTTQGSSTGIALTAQTGSALSPLSRARSGFFSGITREQAGAASADLTMASGASVGVVSSGTGIQAGQRLIGTGIPADTYVYAISGTSITLSRAVTTANPTGVRFSPLGSGAAQNFTYSSTQPVSVELLGATSVPQISHWGSSVIMDGYFDGDRAYVYTAATTAQRNITSGATRSIIAIRIAPSVDNSTVAGFGERELVNRMQLLLRQVDISSNGKFFVELVLNPNIDTTANWFNVGGTSLAQYAVLATGSSLVGGEVVYAFYSDNGVDSYDLSAVKELSNSILGGGTDQFAQTTPPNPTGVFPDGPEVLAIRATNLTNGSRAIDARLSWTEAQA